MMEFSKMWLWDLVGGWRAHEKEFAGLGWESGLLASSDGVGGVAGVEAIWFELVLEPHPEGEKYKVEFGLKVNLKTTLFLLFPTCFGRLHVPVLLHIRLVYIPSCERCR